MAGMYINPMGSSQGGMTPGAGSIRSNAPGGSGFDPSYLQNLATNDARLFQQPQGQGLNFNPLGNLADIPGTQPTGGGNAPVMGLPNTYLQSSLAANPFFTPQSQQQQSGQSVATNNASSPQTQQFSNWLAQIFGSGVNGYGV